MWIFKIQLLLCCYPNPAYGQPNPNSMHGNALTLDVVSAVSQENFSFWRPFQGKGTLCLLAPDKPSNLNKSTQICTNCVAGTISS